MVSPFRKHQISTRAYLAAHAARATGAPFGAAPAMPVEGPVASEYQSLLAQLHDDLRRLNDIPSREAKTALKAKAIETYRPWVEGVLAASADKAAPQDEIVVTMFIWSIDARDWTLALALFAHIDRHGLAMPERFHRSARAILFSEMADAAINEPGSVPHDVLLAAQPGAEPVGDVKNETLARLRRAIGESWARQAEAFDPASESAAAGGKAMLLDAALTALREATRLDAKVGIKKLIEQLEREAKKLAPPEPPANSTS